MNKHLEHQLVDKYPIIFQEYGGDIRKTCMGWGLSCGDGWFNLIDKLCEDINKVIGSRPIKVIATQIKEKFGGLRFYYFIEYKRSPFEKLDYVLFKIMCSHKLGRQHHTFTNFRRKFISSKVEKISSLISKAESESYKICEECGNPGEPKSDGWIKTLCDSCQEKLNEQKN